MKIGWSTGCVSTLVCSVLTACGGIGGDELEADTSHEVASTQAALGVAGGGGGHFGPGSYIDDRAWVCAAGLPARGPLFYDTDCDLGRALENAIAACDRRSSGECYAQGCRLEHTRERCYR